MTAPSLIRAARRAPDARERILAMAALFEEHRYGPDDGCTAYHLRCAGFTDAEIAVYGEPAIAVLVGKPSDLRTTPDGRAKAVVLRKKALALQARAKVEGRACHA